MRSSGRLYPHGKIYRAYTSLPESEFSPWADSVSRMMGVDSLTSPMILGAPTRVDAGPKKESAITHIS